MRIELLISDGVVGLIGIPFVVRGYSSVAEMTSPGLLYIYLSSNQDYRAALLLGRWGRLDYLFIETTRAMYIYGKLCAYTFVSICVYLYVYPRLVFV